MTMPYAPKQEGESMTTVTRLDDRRPEPAPVSFTDRLTADYMAMGLPPADALRLALLLPAPS